MIENLPVNAGGKGLIPAKEDLKYDVEHPGAHITTTEAHMPWSLWLIKGSLCTATLEQSPFPQLEKGL